MRPILLSIPSKPLFFIALAVALGLFVRDLLRRQKTPGTPLTANPLLLVAGGLLLVRLFSPTASFIPEASTFSMAWKPLPIFSYGVMLGTSMIVGWFVAMRFAKQDGLRTEDAGAIYMWAAIWSIVGARLLYVLTNIPLFVADPLEILKVWNGGLVAYGGMIGGFFGSIYECRKRKVPLLQWVDVGSPSVVLGTGITRVGCLLFGCDFGARSDVPWAITFPQGSPAWQQHVAHYGLARDAAQSFPVHPTQVYETLLGLGLFGLLLLIRRYRRFSGQVFIGWVAGYGIFRPLIEVLRDDDQRGNVGPLSTSQFIGLVSVVLCVLLMIQLMRKYRQDPEGSRLWLRPLPATGVDDAAPAAAGSKRKKRR